MSEAVSSVLGTVLMLAVTVSVFGGLAIVVFSEVEEGTPVRPTLRALSDGEALVLQHRGGPALPLEDARLVLQIDGVRVARPMSDFTAQLGEDWEAGESLCVSCLYPGMFVEEAQVVAYRELLLDLGRSSSSGGGGAVGGTYTYPDAAAATVGTLAAFAGAQAAGDAAAATLTEGESGVVPLVTTFGAEAVASALDWTQPENALVEDGADATTTGTTAARYTLADATGTGTVSSVVVRAVVEIPSWRNDGWQLSVCLPTGCTAASGTLGAAAGVQSISYDVTALRPGGGGWSWTDLANAEAVVAPVAVSGGGPQTDSSWELDRVHLEASEEVPALRLDSEWTFPTIPPGTATLQVRARAEGETFTAQLWNGTAWVDVLGVDAPLYEVVSHTLDAAQRNGDLPRLRFVDDTVAGGTPGRLEVDYVRVVTA